MTVDIAPQADALATEKPKRPPTRDLLPTGTRFYVVLALAATLLVASFADFGFGGRALIGAVFCPVLVVLAAIDLEHRLLPNDIIAPAALVIALIVAVSNPGAALSHVAAGAALGLFFFVFALVFAGSLGMGDAKLGFLLGLALGPKTLGGVLVAFAGLLVAALTVIFRQGLSARKQTLAFGPYLALGGVVAYFFG